MKNCQFHNTLTVRTLLRVFMGSTIDQGSKAILGKILAGTEDTKNPNGSKFGLWFCILGRDGLRTVPFFSLLSGPEMNSRTARRPSLPRKTNVDESLTSALAREIFGLLA